MSHNTVPDAVSGNTVWDGVVVRSRLLAALSSRLLAALDPLPRPSPTKGRGRKANSRLESRMDSRDAHITVGF